MENCLMKRSSSLRSALGNKKHPRKYSEGRIARRHEIEGTVSHQKNTSVVQNYLGQLHSRKDSLYVDSRKKCNSAFRHTENRKTKLIRNGPKMYPIPNTRFVKKFQNINVVVRGILKASAK